MIGEQISRRIVTVHLNGDQSLLYTEVPGDPESIDVDDTAPSEDGGFQMMGMASERKNAGVLKSIELRTSVGFLDEVHLERVMEARRAKGLLVYEADQEE